jgi:hypothetical protein
MPKDGKPLRVAIVGSQEYSRLDLVRDYVAQLPAGCVIVSGGAQGVDAMVEEAALAMGLATLIFSADWADLGQNAGLVRNAEIVANADRLVSFWDGASPGTANLVLQAAGRRLPIEIHGPDGAPMPVEQVLRAARGKSR